jgi:hypothetical protein
MPWPPGIPRRRAAGEVVWRLHHPDGRTQSCELRDDSSVGAGWDVIVLEKTSRCSRGGATSAPKPSTWRGSSGRTTCAMPSDQ